MTIITLCGSARFIDEWHHWNKLLSLNGDVVFGMALPPELQSKNTLSDKLQLDVCHLRKIDASESIVILNVDGYLGKSTSHEMLYAGGRGKTILFIERPVLSKNTSREIFQPVHMPGETIFQVEDYHILTLLVKQAEKESW